MKVGDTIASKYFSKMIAKIVELKEDNCAIVVIGLRKCEQIAKQIGLLGHYKRGDYDENYFTNRCKRTFYLS